MFDCIITNPPYNGNPNAQRFGKRKEGEAKKSVPKSIWSKFMFKAFDSCEHLLFLGPDKWRGDLDFYLTFKNGVNKNRGNKGECWRLKQKLMGDRGLKYIKFYGDRVWPDVKASVDIIHWHRDYAGLTEIDTLDGLIIKDLKDYWDKGNWVLPSRDIWQTHSSLMNQLFNWSKDNKVLLRKTFAGLDVKDNTKPQGNYRYAHGVKWDKDEWKWNKEAHIHQAQPKVLISMIRKPRALYIENCGISDAVHYVLVKDKAEGDKIVNLIQSNDFQRVYQLFCVEGGDPARPPFWIYKWLKL